MKDYDKLSSRLVEQAKAGQEAAFEQLVRIYQADVRGFFMRRLGRQAVADDLAQEVFIAAIRNIEQLNDNSSFRGWLMGISRNKMIDYLRKVSRQKTTCTEHIESILAEDSLQRTNNQTNHSSDLKDELFDSLEKCISTLQPKSQDIVNRFYFQDETAEKISENTSVSSSAIRMALLRIRKSLAKCIRNRLGAEIQL